MRQPAVAVGAGSVESPGGRLATGAIATMNSTIWSLSEALSTLRLVIAMVGSVTLMIGWLIVDTYLRHRSSDASSEERKRTNLYNAWAVMTVGIGVIVRYGGLIVIYLVSALFILTARVFASMTRSPLHATEYWTLSWLITSIATVGGAPGSGFESCACRIPRPCRSRGMSIFVEDAAKAVRIVDWCGQWV